jgi:hypothetical protein
MSEPFESGPRNAAIVLCEILQNVPEDQTEFRNELNDLLLKEFPYKSPEMLFHSQTWLLFEAVMKKYISGDEPDEWKQKCVAIYVGKA